MRLLYLPFFFLFIISCSESNRYEYILKDDNFKSNFKLKIDQNFVDLKEGFTFYNAVNQNSQKTPVVLIHGFSVPSYIWSPTFKMLKEKGFYVITQSIEEIKEILNYAEKPIGQREIFLKNLINFQMKLT